MELILDFSVSQKIFMTPFSRLKENSVQSHFVFLLIHLFANRLKVSQAAKSSKFGSCFLFNYKIIYSEYYTRSMPVTKMDKKCERETL